MCKCNGSYAGIDCSHDRSTPPSNLTLPEQGLCKTSKRACAKTNVYGVFISQTVFAKLEEFKITDSGELKTVSTNVLEANYINPTMIRVTFPTNYRKRRTPFKNVYASGFNISLSYDEINYSDSVTLVIYNDLCYSCSASTMECNMTSACNKFPGTTNKPNHSGKNGCKMADGNWYRVGATRVLGCTHCTCEARDYVYCVDLCLDCEYNYRRYPTGESFQDGCKVCMCQGRGKVVCSEEECPYHRSKMFHTFGLS